MGLRDELGSSSKSVPCGVGKLLAFLPDQVSTELIELLADPTVRHSQLERLAKIKNWGGVSAGIFGRHRRKDCGCL